MNKYCNRSTYGLTAQDLILRAVQKEDMLNAEFSAPILPPYEKKDLKWTYASIEAFAKNVYRNLLP